MSEKVLVGGLDGIHTEIELTFSFRISASSSKKKRFKYFQFIIERIFNYVYSSNRLQGRRKGGTLGASAPQCLAEQLTLSQPGGRLCPPQYYKPPQIFRPCDGPKNV